MDENLLSEITPNEEGPSQARVMASLILMAIEGLRDENKRNHIEQRFAHFVSQSPGIKPWVTTLLAAMDGKTEATNQLLTVVSVLGQGTAAERAEALACVGYLASMINDSRTEMQAHQLSIPAWREAGDTPKTLENLRIAISNVVGLLILNHDDYAAAEPLQAEVVALDEQLELPVLHVDRDQLEKIRHLAWGNTSTGVRELVHEWEQQGCDPAQFDEVFHQVCKRYVHAMNSNNADQRAILAHELTYLRSLQPLPMEGANEFLYLLQMKLRNDRNLAQRSRQLRTSLPSTLLQTLRRLEKWTPNKRTRPATQAVSDTRYPPGLQPTRPSGSRSSSLPSISLPALGEEQTSGSPQATMSNESVAAIMGALPAETRARLEAVKYVLPYLAHTLDLLRNPDVTTEDCTHYAQEVDQAVEYATHQAATTRRQVDSPWPHAIEALQIVAGWLRGAPVNIQDMPAMYALFLKGNE
jgi:hypothetical protein